MDSPVSNEGAKRNGGVLVISSAKVTKKTHPLNREYQRLRSTKAGPHTKTMVHTLQLTTEELKLLLQACRSHKLSLYINKILYPEIGSFLDNLTHTIEDEAKKTGEPIA